MRSEQAKPLKELEGKDTRLKVPLAETELDKEIHQEALR